MNKEQKNIFSIYFSFLLAVLLNFAPSVEAQFFGALLFFVMIIAAYVYRYKSDPDSLTRNHMIYLIKSFWISSLFLAIGMAAAAFLADNTIIHNAVNGAQNGFFFSEEEIHIMMMEYIRKNVWIFVGTISPSIVYLIYRVVKGTILTKKNQFVPNIKTWL